MHHMNGKREVTVGGSNGTSNYNPTTPEMYEPMPQPVVAHQPMAVANHLYVKDIERKPANENTRPQMVVPTKITLGGGDTTVAGKAQPTEVIRERESLLPSSDNQQGGVNGIPETLTANELPQEDYSQQQQQNTEHSQTPASQLYSSQTSILVDKDPINELKQMRRRLNQLTKRVQNLEMDSQSYKDERPYIIGASVVCLLVAFMALCRPRR